MTKSRLAHLLQKELNGELTELESDELTRLERLSPDTRRDRASWQRVSNALSEATDEPELHLSSLTARVMRGVHQPEPPEESLTTRIADALRSRFTFPRLVFGTSLLVLAVGLVSSPMRYTPQPQDRVPVAQIVQVGPVGAVMASPVEDTPVRVDVGEEIDDDLADAAPVSIRF